jgi:hypothetical protein
MKGLLLRVGIDQACGEYNAPINVVNGDYLYFPIPGDMGGFKQGMETGYDQIIPYFYGFIERNNIDLCFPEHLAGKGTHLDPDFDHLTYGDQSTGRGNRVSKLEAGDFIAFFSSMRPAHECEHKLVYALIGIFFVKEIMKVGDIDCSRHNRNAHTRVRDMNDDHVVVFADKTRSGRFTKAIPIGEFRDRAYRIRQDLLEAWGGIDVRDGYLQRSVNPPWFLDPHKFISWLGDRDMIASNFS